MDIRWTDSSTRTDYLNEPIVDKAFMEEPKVDGPKKPRGTRLIIMWTPKNPNENNLCLTINLSP